MWTRKLTCVLVLGGLVLSACGGDDDDGEGSGGIESRMCAKADECNILEAGVSAQDCTDTLSMCTADLVTSARTDWENAAEECLEMQNCENFVNCYLAIPGC